MSLVAVMVVVTACRKEEEKKDYPSTLPGEKITYVYESSVFKTELKNVATDEWMVLSEHEHERQLTHKFVWDGERLASLEDHKNDLYYSFEYDGYGRIIRIVCDRDKGFTRTLFYDEDGLLSRSEGARTRSDGTQFATQTLVYTWENGLLKTIEEDYWSHNPGESTVSRKSTFAYTWKDGNVISTERRVRKNGQDSQTRYNYEYGPAVNPLHGFVYLMIPGMGVFFDYEGIDGLSRNLPSHIESDPIEFYDYSYAGDPATSFGKLLFEYATPVMRMTTDYTVELEYLR